MSWALVLTVFVGQVDPEDGYLLPVQSINTDPNPGLPTPGTVVAGDGFVVVAGTTWSDPFLEGEDDLGNVSCSEAGGFGGNGLGGFGYSACARFAGCSVPKDNAWLAYLGGSGVFFPSGSLLIRFDAAGYGAERVVPGVGHMAPGCFGTYAGCDICQGIGVENVCSHGLGFHVFRGMDMTVFNDVVQPSDCMAVDDCSALMPRLGLFSGDHVWIGSDFRGYTMVGKCYNWGGSGQGEGMWMPVGVPNGDDQFFMEMWLIERTCGWCSGYAKNQQCGTGFEEFVGCSGQGLSRGFSRYVRGSSVYYVESDLFDPARSTGPEPFHYDLCDSWPGPNDGFAEGCSWGGWIAHWTLHFDARDGPTAEPLMGFENLVREHITTRALVTALGDKIDGLAGIGGSDPGDEDFQHVTDFSTYALGPGAVVLGAQQVNADSSSAFGTFTGLFFNQLGLYSEPVVKIPLSAIELIEVSDVVVPITGFGGVLEGVGSPIFSTMWGVIKLMLTWAVVISLVWDMWKQFLWAFAMVGGAL